MSAGGSPARVAPAGSSARRRTRHPLARRGGVGYAPGQRVMVLTFMTALLWSLSLTGYGAWFPTRSLSPSLRLAAPGLIGLCVLSWAGTVLHFFAPIDATVSAIAFGAGLLPLAFRKGWTAWGSFSKAEIGALSVLLLVVSFGAQRPIEQHDPGLYHLQAVKWMKETALPLGLANLHGRFGFNSSWFTAAAVLETPLLVGKSIHFLNALVLFFFGSIPILSLTRATRDTVPLSEMFRASLLLPFLLWLLSNQLSSLSADLPAACLVLVILSLILDSGSRSPAPHRLIGLAAVLAVYAATLKVSAAAVILGAGGALALSRSALDRRSLAVTLTVIGSIGAAWLARGVALSGCLAYPLQASCVPGVPWRVPLAQVAEMALRIKAWARWPHRPADEVMSTWNWLIPWLTSLPGDPVMVGSGALLLGSLLLVRFRRNARRDPGADLGPWGVSVATCAGGILFWFFTAPQPRFGMGYIWGVALLAVSYAWTRGTPRFAVGRLLAVLMIPVSIWLVISTVQTIEPFQLLGWKAYDAGSVRREVTRSGEAVYVPVQGDQCWSSPLPCTPYVNARLEIARSSNGRIRMFSQPD